MREGVLTAIVNQISHTLQAGDSIIIPRRAPHCMINLTSKPLRLHERQIGVCFEDDNERLADINGRPVAKTGRFDLSLQESIRLYRRLTDDLKTGR